MPVPSLDHRPAQAPRAVPPNSPQGFLTAFHVLDVPRLWRLFQMRPPMDGAHAARIASLFVSAPLQSGLNLVDHALHSRAVARTELEGPPVFVIGHWRSGTTLLQTLLNLDDRLVTPNLAEVFFPRSFLTAAPLLCPLTRPFLPKTRPQDNVAVGWEEPQEDEIAQIGLTLLTPYLMLAFPYEPQAWEHFLRLETMSLAEQREWKQTYYEYLQRLTYKHRRRILLKSPTNTWKIPTFLKMFPGCKFIYIHRHPHDVIVSQLHLWKTLIPQYTLATLDHSRDEDVVFDLYLDCFKTYEHDRELIPEGDLYELRYESLEADPLEEMRTLYRDLGLPGWDSLEPRLQDEVPRHRAFRKNRFHRDTALLERISERCEHVFERFGYDPTVPETPFPEPTGELAHR